MYEAGATEEGFAAACRSGLAIQEAFLAHGSRAVEETRVACEALERRPATRISRVGPGT